MIRNTYTTEKGIECLSSCIYNYLHNDGFYIDKSDIFFAGNGFDIRYTGKFEKRMIYSLQYKSNFKFLNLYVPEYIQDNRMEFMQGDMKRFLINSVNKRERIIIRVSSSFLPYNRLFHKSELISHYINVIDYDAKANCFIISDGCPPSNEIETYQNLIDEDELIANWSTMNGEYIILKYNNNCINRVSEEAAHKFTEQLKDYTKDGFCLLKKRYRGYRSIITLMNDITPLFDDKCADIKQIMAEVQKQLRLNGFMQAKYFISDRFSKLDITTSVYNEYRKVIDEWNKIIMKMVKAAIRKNGEDFRRIINEAEKLTVRENNILKEICGELS